jgi:hypothetical protein
MPKQVFLPFQVEFKDRMLSGKKTSTTRPRRYGRPGDWFRAFGAIFILTEVYQAHLNVVAFTCYGEEGFNSSDEFRTCWNKLHPNVTFEERPNRTVYLHRFTRRN